MGVCAERQRGALKSQISNLKTQNYKIVANLPYQITTPMLKKFLQSENKPKELILMVQKEVAERICTTSSKMNFLAVLVQFYSKPEILKFIPKECFWPEPEVESAIVRVTEVTKLTNVTDEKLFFRIVKAGFSEKRKKIKNSLSGGLQLPIKEIEKWLIKSEINPNRRAETLSLSDWLNLYYNKRSLFQDS